jgi:hypothetical protein
MIFLMMTNMLMKYNFDFKIKYIILLTLLDYFTKKEISMAELC